MNRRLSFVLFAIASSLTAQRLAEVEPNNSAATAQVVAAGQHIAANLVAGEQDWYSITLTAPCEFHAQTSGNNAVNSTVDTVVFLFDASGTTQLAWNDNQRGSHSDLGVNLPAGSYTIEVVGKLATTAGDYGLDILAWVPAVVGAVEGAEPNGNPTGGGVPTPIALGSIFTGNLSSTTDTDWFTFSLTRRGVVQAIVQDDGGIPQLDKTVLTLFQETAPGTWTSVTSSTSATSHRAIALNHAGTLPAGNYALQVSTNAAGGTPPLVYTGIGNYGVRTLLLDLPDTNTVPEAPEPNSSLGSTSAIALGDMATGTITAGDNDWFQFAVSAPTTVVATTENGPVPIAGTNIQILDINGNSLSTASSLTAHARLVFTIPVAGLYFVRVAGGGINLAGDYILHFGGAPALALPATFNQQPPSTNACVGSNTLRPALVNPNGEVPQLGTTMVVRLQNALPNAVVLPFFGFSNTASGATPLPVDLGAVGAPTCFLRVDPAQVLVGIADTGGVYFHAFTLPVFPGLRGLTIYMQAMLIDATNNSLGIAMTNDVRFVLGDRGY